MSVGITTPEEARIVLISCGCGEEAGYHHAIENGFLTMACKNCGQIIMTNLNKVLEDRRSYCDRRKGSSFLLDPDKERRKGERRRK